MCGRWWKVVVADGNDARHNRDDLSEVLAQFWRRRWAADT